MSSGINFYADSWDENDILYGWDFDLNEGRYVRAFSKKYCAKFPKPPLPCGPPQDNVRPLYVSKLDQLFTEDLLWAMFEPFGTVTGVNVKLGWRGLCRGFGFVWYSTDQEANYAMQWMNGRFIHGKALYVALAEYKEDRRARLKQDNIYDENYESYEDDDEYESSEEEYFYDDHSHSRSYDQWEPNDPLYGWVFDVYQGYYTRKLRSQDCATFPKRKEPLGLPEPNVAPLLVTNLYRRVTDSSLRTMFEPFGSVQDVKIDKNRNGKPRGYVWFSRCKDADYAVEWMDDRYVDNYRLCVVRCFQEPTENVPKQTSTRSHTVSFAKPIATAYPGAAQPLPPIEPPREEATSSRRTPTEWTMRIDFPSLVASATPAPISPAQWVPQEPDVSRGAVPKRKPQAKLHPAASAAA